jgi:hypothetical protein
MPAKTKEPEAIVPETLTIELDVQEAQLIFTTFEQIPVNGPEGKRIAANVQAKIMQAAASVVT